jgi:hypothetical protein
MTKVTLAHLLTHSMMTPAERAKGRFMRAPDGHGDGGKTFTQEQLDAAVEKATGDLQGLKDNLTAALDEAKEAKRKLRAASEIKPEDVAAIEAERDKALADLAAANKAAKDATAAAEKATKALETETGFTQKLLIQDGLKSALIANGVKDEDFIDSLTAKFAAGASVVVDGETRKAMHGDKPLGDYIKEWAGSEAGKKFVAAPANSGGGSGGGGKGGEGGKTMLRSAFNALPSAGQAAFVKEGGKPIDEAA